MATKVLKVGDRPWVMLGAEWPRGEVIKVREFRGRQMATVRFWYMGRREELEYFSDALVMKLPR